jgi:nitrite reductase (NO-forming)
MTVLHVISGMSGAVMVLPSEGLRDKTGKPLHYDRIYYIGENDFYIPRGEDGKFQSFTDASGFFPKTLELMRKLVPSHVVFEGRVGALTGKNALQAKVGETVLIVHSQANRDSRPHLIGGHGDYVWETGKFHNPAEKDLETWSIWWKRWRSSLHLPSTRRLRLPQSHAHPSGGTRRADAFQG